MTLDADTRRLVERFMAERSLSFKQALNEAIRRGLADGTAVESPTCPRSMGTPRVELTKALSLAAALEDDVVAQQLTDGR